jgi:hypothetical protein
MSEIASADVSSNGTTQVNRKTDEVVSAGYNHYSSRLKLSFSFRDRRHPVNLKHSNKAELNGFIHQRKEQPDDMKWQTRESPTIEFRIKRV